MICPYKLFCAITQYRKFLEILPLVKYHYAFQLSAKSRESLLTLPAPCAKIKSPS